MDTIVTSGMSPPRVEDVEEVAEEITGEEAHESAAVHRADEVADSVAHREEGVGMASAMQRASGCGARLQRPIPEDLPKQVRCVHKSRRGAGQYGRGRLEALTPEHSAGAAVRGGGAAAGSAAGARGWAVGAAHRHAERVAAGRQGREGECAGVGAGASASGAGAARPDEPAGNAARTQSRSALDAARQAPGGGASQSASARKPGSASGAAERVASVGGSGRRAALPPTARNNAGANDDGDGAGPDEADRQKCDVSDCDDEGGGGVSGGTLKVVERRPRGKDKCAPTGGGLVTAKVTYASMDEWKPAHRVPAGAKVMCGVRKRLPALVCR